MLGLVFSDPKAVHMYKLLDTCAHSRVVAFLGSRKGNGDQREQNQVNLALTDSTAKCLVLLKPSHADVTSSICTEKNKGPEGLGGLPKAAFIFISTA